MGHIIFETFEIYTKFTTIPHIFQKFKRKIEKGFLGLIS